ncbi:PfkB family carbohydrate kinase [Pseudaestuariivita sp.]|uniref:PfkB family carbohydrate kinase n=1 Tax=Pseudaestuariivita sp. TaxID=2211669 RepID=UPI00405A2D42
MSVFVCGSLHLDVVLRAPHLPGKDETVTGSAVDYVFGGKGGNQAVAAARMGAETRFAGRVGSDAFAERLREGLTAASVDIAQLQTGAGASGMSAAIVDAAGDYGAVIVSAANLEIDVSQIEVPPVTEVVLLQNEVPEAVNLAVAEKAKAIGAQVWLNAAPARPLSPALLGGLDMVVVNRVEAEALGKIACPVLTTLGSAGVFYQGKAFPAYAVEVISTHGAGDMFQGALAAEWVRIKDMAQAIDFAQAAAALHVSSDLDARTRLDAQAVRDFQSSGK